MNVERLKRAVIKEEYVAITGDFQKAVLLNQFIYWSERVKDFDEFITQENKRAEQHGLSIQDLTYGWIYKTAEELSDETMLGLSPASIRTHIKALIDMGYISERNNPKYKWDRTKQYHVNLVEIAKALMKDGYSFEGYKIELPFLKIENGESEDFKAIPKTTIETPSKITPKSNKKERKTSYDEILSKIEDDELRKTYYEFIKMRQMIKSPMTDKALEMLIDKVEKLEPLDIDRQKRLLENAIMNNWKSVYPLKDERQQGNQQTNSYRKPEPKEDEFTRTLRKMYGENKETTVYDCNGTEVF